MPTPAPPVSLTGNIRYPPVNTGLASTILIPPAHLHTSAPSAWLVLCIFLFALAALPGAAWAIWYRPDQPPLRYQIAQLWERLIDGQDLRKPGDDQ